MPPFHARWIELFSGCVWTLWSLYVALMPSGFAGIPQWAPVARIGPNCAWAALISVFAVMQVISALRNKLLGRFIATSGMFVCCAFLVDGFFLSGVPGQGIVLYGAWVVAQGLMLPWMLRRQR